MTAARPTFRRPRAAGLVAAPPLLCILLTALLSGCGDRPSTAPATPGLPSSAPAPAATLTPTATTPAPGQTRVATTSATVSGIDVSAYQPHLDWARQRRGGVRFVWIKASEGTTWRSPHHAAQRAGARAAGLYTGSYHYARPLGSTGAAQARALLAAGGGWSADGRTLPGALDLEENTGDAAGGDPCYGLSPARMLAWIRDFTTTYRHLTGRDALIYVTAGWWNRCTGADTTLAGSNPLWLYDHDGPAGPLPSGWTRPTVWQSGVRDGLDRNTFFGTEAQLRAWAVGP
ncbi:MAG: GH25 family lysozyme [Kineosporiaceae bacterium]